MVLFVFQFHPVCNFEKILSFGLGYVRSERVIIDMSSTAVGISIDLLKLMLPVCNFGKFINFGLGVKESQSSAFTDFAAAVHQHS